jgi:hypothetical protein
MKPPSFLKIGLLRLICQLFITGFFSVLAYASEPAKSNPKNITPPGATPQCGDFLSAINQKPKYLDFVGCEKTERHGLAALESQYQVKGINAKSVEGFFVKTAQMPKLRYLCCGWESTPENPKTDRRTGTYKSGSNLYEISMSSGETTTGKRRASWPKIPAFHVEAVLYLESP